MDELDLLQMFRAHLLLSLVWFGLGIGYLVQGEPGFGLFNLAAGIAWVVIAFLKRKGILPDRRIKPPQPNPYEENLPG